MRHLGRRCLQPAGAVTSQQQRRSPPMRACMAARQLLYSRATCCLALACVQAAEHGGPPATQLWAAALAAGPSGQHVPAKLWHPGGAAACGGGWPGGLSSPRCSCGAAIAAQHASPPAHQRAPALHAVLWTRDHVRTCKGCSKAVACFLRKEGAGAMQQVFRLRLWRDQLWILGPSQPPTPSVRSVPFAQLAV